MKKLFVVFMIMFSSSMMLLSGYAEAKRLGGGGSFGRQSSSFGRSSTAAQPAPRPAAPPAAAAPARPPSRWGGILGGALLGLGLGALFSHLGLSQGMGTMLMMLLLFFVIMMAVRAFMARKAANGSRPAFGANNGSAPDAYSPYARDSAVATPDVGSFTPEIGSRLLGNAAYSSVPPVAYGSGIPADFDTAGFVRTAKTYFIRLQAAWDKADISDIREFTTSEMFGELRLQLQERGQALNVTDVVSIDGELLGIETAAGQYLASVKFSGLIKEAPDASAEPFAEIWNLSKPEQGPGGWVLAGIEQVK